jgi:hypothetical protein
MTNNNSPLAPPTQEPLCWIAKVVPDDYLDAYGIKDGADLLDEMPTVGFRTKEEAIAAAENAIREEWLELAGDDDYKGEKPDVVTDRIEWGPCTGWPEGSVQFNDEWVGTITVVLPIMGAVKPEPKLAHQGHPAAVADSKGNKLVRVAVYMTQQDYADMVRHAEAGGAGVPLVGVHDFEYPDAEDFEDGEAIGPVDCDMCGGSTEEVYEGDGNVVLCKTCHKAGGA